MPEESGNKRADQSQQSKLGKRITLRVVGIRSAGVGRWVGGAVQEQR